MNLTELVKVPDSQRDQSWENKFFQELVSSNIELDSPQAQPGPDGWPYMIAKTSDSANEPVQNLLHWLSTRGIGLVVNPDKNYPDYVFTYGMIWSFRQTGYFYREVDKQNTGEVEFKNGQKLYTGAPTQEYLPDYVRQVIKNFLFDQGILQPKILLISTDEKNYDLAFSLESLGNPAVAEHQGIAEALSWFLPPHYSVLLINEKGLPKFVNLKD